MLQMLKWGFALLVASASVAQVRDNEPKHHEVVKEGAFGFGSPGQNLSYTIQDAQTVNGMLANQYLTDLTRSQTPYFVYQEKPPQGSGLSLVPVDDAARAHLKLPKGQGLIATSVAPDGPAAHAGVCQNDILLTLGDTPLGKPEDLEQHLKAAGDKPLGLILLHHGEKKTLQVQPQVNVTFGPAQPALPEFWIGVSVSPVEPALRAHLKIPADRGLIATQIFPDSPAAKAELKVNDILLTMAGQPLRDQPGLADLVQKNGDKAVGVEIFREGSRQTLQVTPERRKDQNAGQAQVAFVADFNVLRPGVVLPGQESPVLFYTKPNDTPYLLNYYSELSKASGNGPQPQANPAPDRLDAMAAEIKELRKAIEELGKVLKDRR